MFGVQNPANVGSFPLSIGALDQNGNIVDPTHPLELQPGQNASVYYPPAGAASVITVGFTQWPDGTPINGTAILEFDTPNA